MLTGKFQPNHQFPNDDNRKNYLTPRRLTEALERVDRLKQIVQDSGYTVQQVGLAFLLRFPVVPIPGAKSPAHVEQNVMATEVQLPDHLFDAIREEFASYNFYLRYKVHV
jgi:aryl-alcohol dehydrogenase-like predicted oxidoreductase